MYGYWYSVHQYFKFERKEVTQLFWTSLIFGFILSFRKWGLGSKPDIVVGLANLVLAFVIVMVSMLAHVSLQKLVAIKLGYSGTYTYWMNGLLLSLLLGFITVGYFTFILPGSVQIEHIPKLRLGKFRYGINLKDIARVALAGAVAHVLMIMIIGIFYFASGRNEVLLAFIVVNILLAIFSMLPVPKIDIPRRMDAGSDGLGMFYFSRTLYVLVLATILIFSGLVFLATSYAKLWWFFILAFLLGCVFAIIYSVTIEQKN